MKRIRISLIEVENPFVSSPDSISSLKKGNLNTIQIYPLGEANGYSKTLWICEIKFFKLYKIFI